MDTIEYLTRFGLTKQEATLYMMLFSEGELTGYEASKLTGISRSNTYTALAGLVEKGAAYLIEGTAARYTPVAVQDFCSGKIRELQECKQKLIENIPSRSKEVDGYITIKSEKQILLKMKNMLTEATQRVYLSMSSEIIQLVLEDLKDGISRGIKIVIITNEPFEFAGATVYHADKHQKQIRLIVDSNSVLTGDISDGDSSTCLYSKKKNLVDLFKESLNNEIKLIELTKGL